jgi:hypothetical protein
MEPRLAPITLLSIFAFSFPLSILTTLLVRSLVPSLAEPGRGRLLLQLFSQGCQMLAASWMLRRELARISAPWSSVGLSMSRLAQNAVLAARGYVLLVPVLLVAVQVTELVGRAIGVQPERPDLARAIQAAGRDPVAAVLLFLVAVIAAPLVEELLFRGLVFGALRARFGFWPSAVLSSLLFAALHGLRAIPLTQFVLGVFFCYLYESTGTLATGVFAHSLNNLGAFLLSLQTVPHSRRVVSGRPAMLD